MYDHVTLPVRVITLVLQLLGITCTIWRIYFRLKIGRFWWEDAWAAVALFACLASLIGEWTFWLTYDLTSNVGFWFYTLGYTSVVRTTQLSIFFSIIRFVNETGLRRFTCVCAACCGIFCIVLMTGKIWLCASDPAWHHGQYPVCSVRSQMMIFEFTSNCMTVGALIALPLRVLWRMRLPRRRRRMILCIFASSVTLAITAVFHITGHFLNNLVLTVTGIDIQIASSIIVCNCLVVVTYAYRFLLRDGHLSKDTTTSEMESELDDDDDDFTEPKRQTLTLTTVELDSWLSVSSRSTNQSSEESRPACTNEVDV